MKMKYLNTGVWQVAGSLNQLEEKSFGEKKYIHGWTSNQHLIRNIIEYCEEKGIECRHEEYKGIEYFSIEINERGEPGYEARQV